MLDHLSADYRPAGPRKLMFLILYVSHPLLLTVVEGVDGVNHELEQSVPEVAAGVQDGNVGRSPPRVLPRHHARHRRARHARLEKKWYQIKLNYDKRSKITG